MKQTKVFAWSALKQFSDEYCFRNHDLNETELNADVTLYH